MPNTWAKLGKDIYNACRNLKITITSKYASLIDGLRIG